jgi:hypothetical protein
MTFTNAEENRPACEGARRERGEADRGQSFYSANSPLFLKWRLVFCVWCPSIGRPWIWDLTDPA